MPKRNPTPRPVQDETNVIKSRLEETEETLRAIRQYMVDAFVVTRSGGEQIVTLNEADFPYRRMVEAMNEGAVTVIPDGTIFYCNPRFAEMIQIAPEKLIGVRFSDLIRREQQSSFDAIFKEAGHNSIRGEFCLQPPHGDCIPVQLSVYQLAVENTGAISIIATDISERRQAEEKIRSLASQLAVAEQEERHRISQILHDDLQQRLFAIKTQLAILMNDGDLDKPLISAAEELKQVQRWLSDAIGITRSLSIDLSPVILQGEGLAEAILWLSAQMKEQYGLQVWVDAKDNLNRLESHIRILLFQAIREIFFNTVKHSGTSQVTIIMEQKDDQHARIAISDEGKGFDVASVMNDSKTAHGLLVLQDRLGLMGCNIEITAKPGQGTKIVIEAPMPKDSASAETT